MEHDGPQRSRLFLNARDQQRFHLRAELLTPGQSVDRIEAIRQQLDDLDHQRAMTWTEES